MSISLEELRRIAGEPEKEPLYAQAYLKSCVRRAVEEIDYLQASRQRVCRHANLQATPEAWHCHDCGALLDIHENHERPIAA